MAFLCLITGLQDVQARAVLCPLSGRGEAIPMPYRTLSIGTGNTLLLISYSAEYVKHL